MRILKTRPNLRGLEITAQTSVHLSVHLFIQSFSQIVRPRNNTWWYVKRLEQSKVGLRRSALLAGAREEIEEKSLLTYRVRDFVTESFPLSEQMTDRPVQVFTTRIG